MEYETAAQFIELLALLIMVAAFYYGYSLIKFIPKELKSLQLVVLALFFMILRRVASLFSFEIGWVVVLVSAISLAIAILALLGFRRMYQNVRGR
uniref:Uncharacterized protein n=1 Tax=Candidatus Methanogaster sp. ANME-2c ERB4 TaxID=2759911 RepID=A0A7G9YLM6_9EURY|nr:hypothetical protein MOGPJHGO_00013 [Methanosarcinales archaeon ANME-2c ERB4]